MSQEILNRPNNDMTQMSFQQKSTLVSLVITIMAALYYFVNAYPLQPIAEATGTIPAGFIGLIINTAVIITLTQIVLQTVLAFGTGSTPAKTAHEATAELKGQRNGYFVLAVSVFFAIASIWGDMNLFYTVKLLIVGFIASEVVKQASQLVYGWKARF